MNTYQYYLPDYCGSVADPYSFKAHAPWSAEELAQDAAEDFHSNHDGWECKWPLEFCVLLDGKWYSFTVDREAVPSFYVVR